jgi:hypothetical protein
VKSSLLAAGLVGLATVGLWLVGGGARPLPARADDSPRVGAPLAHANLTIYFLHGPDATPGAKVLSLPEALERELAVVHETSNVNTLAVENRSDEYELFIQSGDIVKGGRQDRMAATDMLLPPKSGLVALPAHCVEQGRWAGRGSEDARRFRSAGKSAVGYEMKVANLAGRQGAVWQSVGENQSKLNEKLKASVNAPASPTSFQLTLESPAVQAKVAEYEAALKAGGESGDDIVGVAFAINGSVTGAEVYGSNAIFRKAWPKLLNAAVVEALAERTDKPTVAAPPAWAVQRFLARAAEPAQQVRESDGELAAVARQEAARLGRRVREAPNQREAGFLASVEYVQIIQNDNIGQPDAPETGIAPNPSPNAAAGRQAGVGVDVIQEVADLQPEPQPRPRPPAPPANPGGNRLSTSLSVNGTTVLVESRDPARKNAVIHRSYLKK